MRVYRGKAAQANQGVLTGTSAYRRSILATRS
ncbi:hypothetical protein SY94_6081 (plasmid) [Agrobacterium tumefaciens]|nr:hypothetical protein SY94_6081 [Agrobacterium tumefaciens]